jgi:hypothetical protein
VCTTVAAIDIDMIMAARSTMPARGPSSVKIVAAPPANAIARLRHRTRRLSVLAEYRMGHR